LTAGGRLPHRGVNEFGRRGVAYLLRRALSVLVAAVLAAGTAAAQEPVDLELILAVDVSRSIDDEEAALQREGYAEAFRHPAVINAIQSNANRRIAVAYVE
jgi:uncharacterized protein DUF1194